MMVLPTSVISWSPPAEPRVTSWYHVTLLEGRNREVRRLWASQDVTVSRLKRVRYGAVFLPKRLRMGDWSELST